MHQNKLFNQTRTRLALWYASVMGVILSMSGFGVYEAIVHAHWVALDQELESVAGTLHDSLEPTLKQPGRLEPIAQNLLPDLCLEVVSCLTQTASEPTVFVPGKRHILGAINQGDYYMRLFDTSGRLVAVAGAHPPGLSPTLDKKLWQTLQDTQGIRYDQLTLSLHTQDYYPWGYLQVGRSFQEFDNYLTVVKFILLLGLPMAMLLVAASSWWLAGRAMQPVYQSYRQIQQFTADAAHELRTPLAAIQATVESTLRMDQLSELEARETLQTLERQNQRLSGLVQDLLLLSRMEQQTPVVKRRLSCLNDIISDLVEELAALAISADVLLTTDIRVHQPLYVMGDEDQLYRLVANLMTNAIQYTPSGGRVRVILDRNDHQALIQVQDTGIGIAPEDQTRIFDRFYRVNSDRSRASGGAGLGLAIAAAIVQTHDGSLIVQSESGKGSTFTLRLPLKFTPNEARPL